MTTAFFDCFSGAAGDMIVGALVDAGADAAALQDALSTLGLEGYSLSIEKVRKQGFATTRFDVALDPDKAQPHRHLADIVAIIDASSLPERVRQNAKAVFEKLAVAEAAVHGTSVDKVHFHEVGAVDAILDVVGAVHALYLLGVDRVVCSPIAVGSGTVTCAHGVMPVPAPATAELLKGVPTYAGSEPKELTTPTGAAILTSLAAEFGSQPAMRVSGVGYGAGTREGEGLPNVLRVMVGDTETAKTDTVAVLETNIDDATPEIVGFALERLLEGGALDAYAVPIQMKKSRPGVVLTVLCEPARVPQIEAILYRETPTFGVRRREEVRSCLVRRLETVETTYGKIRIKVGQWRGGLTASPEYEDCKAAALEHDAALRDVMAAARSAWMDQAGD